MIFDLVTLTFQVVLLKKIVLDYDFWISGVTYCCYLHMVATGELCCLSDNSDYGYFQETSPFQSPFTTRMGMMGIRRTYFHFKLPGPQGGPSIVDAKLGNMFQSHNCLSFTPIIMKLHSQTAHESGMCSIDFGVKGSKVKVTMHWLLKMVLSHNYFPCTLHYEILHKNSPLVEDVPYWFQVKRSKVKVTMHWLPKIVLVHNINRFPFTPSITMKFHIQVQTPHKLRMCPIDVLVKRSKVKMHWLLKMVYNVCCIIAFPFHL